MGDASYYIRLFLRALFCRYPHRLLMGALAGLVGHFALVAIAPIARQGALLTFVELNLTECILVGVFVFTVPTLFSRYRLSDDLEHKILAIRRIALEGKLSNTQIRMLYLELARQLLHERSSLHAQNIRNENPS